MNSKRSRWMPLALMTLSVLGADLAVSTTRGQDRPARLAGTAEPAATSARRVPPYFGQVGLTPEQREKIYSIRARHQARIVDLKKELQDASVKEMAECEAVLTDAQREQLNQKRAARKSGNPQGRPSTVPATGGAATGNADAS